MKDDQEEISQFAAELSGSKNTGRLLGSYSYPSGRRGVGKSHLFSSRANFARRENLARHILDLAAEKESSNTKPTSSQIFDVAENLLIFDRVEEMAASAGVDGIIVMAGMENEAGHSPLVDLTSKRARDTLSALTRLTDDRGQAGARFWLRQISKQHQVVEVLNRDAAAKGFVALLLAHVSSWFRGNAAKSADTISFTVEASTPGLQIEYFPQFKFAPEVFAPGFTPIVNGSLERGYYHFQGLDAGRTQVHRDSGVYEASDTSRHATLQGF